MSRVRDSSPLPRPPRRRYSLLLLIIPVVGYLFTPFIANPISLLSEL